jgi:hypothetical protein
MECTDWLDQSLDPADARFLMLTAITHHRFTSPVWGAQEVRKLHDELAELDTLAIQAVREHDLTQAAAGRRTTRYDRSRATIRRLTLGSGQGH